MRRAWRGRRFQTTRNTVYLVRARRERDNVTCGMTLGLNPPKTPEQRQYLQVMSSIGERLKLSLRRLAVVQAKHVAGLLREDGKTNVEKH